MSDADINCIKYGENTTDSYANFISATPIVMLPKRINIVALCIDIVSFLSLMLAIALVEFLWPPRLQGLLCGDLSIRKNKLEDTVPLLWIFLATIAVDVVIVLVELDRLWLENQDPELYAPFQLMPYRIANFTIHRVFVRIFYFIGYFWTGMGFTGLTTSMIKRFVGELRPYFWSICQPVANCSLPTHFVSDVVCTSEDTEAISRARRSFPSGHTSLSFYQAVFVMLYLQSRVLKRDRFGNLTLPFVQMSFAVAAIYTGASRIGDHAHHYKDVYVGALWGSALAVLASIWCRLFSQDDNPIKKSSQRN